MRYLRTRLATDWPKERPRAVKILRALLFFIPEGNPGYEEKMHLVREWLVEFDERDEPWREIGLDAEGAPVLAGPDRQNYGFWCDTNMTWSDFSGEPVEAVEFENLWQKAAPLRQGEVSTAAELAQGDRLWKSEPS